MLSLLSRLPGALMIIPLLCGVMLNTLDKAHLPPIEAALRSLGATPVVDEKTGTEHFELLRIGGYTTALAGPGAASLIAMFLVCVAAQMNFSTGSHALRKGSVITVTKLLLAITVGYLWAYFSDEFHGWLNLSMVAIIAAMSNGNGGLYLALTGQYGDRSDVGAVAVISLNDGPFLTLVSLGLLGEQFPVIAFLAVLIPMIVGFTLGQLSPTMREFLKPGETLCIPFFAFALGTTMNLSVFLDAEVLLGGVVLGLMTLMVTGFGCTAALALFGDRRCIAGFAEASTAGNAIQTPLAIMLAATASVAAGTMPSDRAAQYAEIVPIANAQISVSTLLTAILCPFAVYGWLWVLKRRQEPHNIGVH